MSKQSQDGFTLVEVIMAIVIIAILVVVVTPRFFDFATYSRMAACHGNQANIESAAAIGYASSAIATTSSVLRASYPESIQEMVDMRLLDVMPVCPSGGEYESTYDQIDGTVSCSYGEHVLKE